MQRSSHTTSCTACIALLRSSVTGAATVLCLGTPLSHQALQWDAQGARPSLRFYHEVLKNDVSQSLVAHLSGVFTASAGAAAAVRSCFSHSIIPGPHCKQSEGGSFQSLICPAYAQGSHRHGGTLPEEGASTAAAGVAQRLASEPGDRLPPGAQFCAGGHSQVRVSLSCL